MKKKFCHNEKSDKVCVESGCEKKLKMNVVDRNPDANRCYVHHIKHTGKEGRREYYQ